MRSRGELRLKRNVGRADAERKEGGFKAGERGGLFLLLLLLHASLAMDGFLGKEERISSGKEMRSSSQDMKSYVL